MNKTELEYSIGDTGVFEVIDSETGAIEKTIEISFPQLPEVAVRQGRAQIRLPLELKVQQPTTLRTNLVLSLSRQQIADLVSQLLLDSSDK